MAVSLIWVIPPKWPILPGHFCLSSPVDFGVVLVILLYQKPCIDMGMSEMGYTPNYSHLVGIMIITIGCRGTLFSDKAIFLGVDQSEFIGGLRVQVSGPKAIGSDATSCQLSCDTHAGHPNELSTVKWPWLSVLTGYFYGIIHSINGVSSVLITAKGP